jgi:lipopolysaccharide biosynthesis glycosyltransferase
LSKSYDEILYLDFDVVCLTNENFFETWNLNKGICVYNNSSLVKTIEAVTERSQTIRSPTSKYYNAQAMLIEKGLNPKNKVINTGIIGANREHINQLKYFENFDDDLNIMTQLKSNYDIFPKKIIDFFGYDNETLFSVKLNEHKVPVQWLDNHWHYFFDTQGFIPKETKFVHTINKKFDVVWRRYYA